MKPHLIPFLKVSFFSDISFEDDNKASLFEYRDITGHLQDEKRTHCDTIHRFAEGGAKVERPLSVIQVKPDFLRSQND